jgi:DNA-binding CsgD family transcriptional regulator
MAGRDTGDDFVAREAELATLHDALCDARAGQPAIVAVEGEPGIGKTRLLNRFLAQAPDIQVLAASGDEAEMSLRYGIVAQLFAEASPHLGTDDRLLLAGADGSDEFAAGAALLAAFGALQERGTVVVVLDDLQWADLPSARAILFALRRLRRDNALVLLAFRTDTLPRLGESWPRLLAERAQRIRLHALTAPDVCALAATLFGLELAPAVCERLREHTGGNPLHLRTLLEELPASALTDSSALLPAPRSYSTTVIAQVARLSARAQDLLAAASVLGQHFSLPLAAAVAGIDNADAAFDEASATHLLTSAVRAGIREAAFSHPLMRAAIYNDLSAERRRRLHLAAARLATGREVLTQRVAAAQEADDQLAAELAAMAGDCIADGQLQEAANNLITAARLSTGRATGEDRLLRAVELLLVAGDAGAHWHLEDVRRCQDGFHKRFIISVLTAASGQLGEATAQLERLLNDAMLPRDPAVFARAAGSLALFYSMHGRAPAAIAWATRVLDAAEDDLIADLTARQALASALAMSGRIPDALGLLASLSPSKMIPGPFEPELLTTRGSLKASVGDFPGAVADLGAVVRWSRSGAHLRSLPDAYAALAHAEYGLGAWDDAAAHGELAVSLARDLGHLWFLAHAHKAAADIYSARGDWQPATEHVAGARQAARQMDVPGEIASACISEATLAWAQGSWEAVLSALVPLREHDLGLLTGSFDPITWRLCQAEALLNLGQLDRAARTLDDAAAASAQAPAMSVGIHRLRGGLAVAQGRPDEARASFALGLEAAAGCGTSLEHALVAMTYGRFLRTGGNRREAIRLLRTAQAILSGLGAVPFLTACESALSSCGVRVPGATVPANPHGLTAKEQVVARLVAAGLSNKQAAAELYVSPKAVEYHLGNIYAKAGISSRHQIATVLGRNGSPASFGPG